MNKPQDSTNQSFVSNERRPTGNPKPSTPGGPTGPGPGHGSDWAKDAPGRRGWRGPSCQRCRGGPRPPSPVVVGHFRGDLGVVVSLIVGVSLGTESVWGPLVVSPLVGLAIGHLSRPWTRLTFWGASLAPWCFYILRLFSMDWLWVCTVCS